MRPTGPISGRAFRHGFLALACCLFSGFGGALSAQSPESLTRAFDVPAGVAEKTLKLFSEQSGRGLVVAAEMAITIRTNAVRGQFTPREAIDRMLVRTGLVAKEDPKNGAFVVHREIPDPNGQRAAPTTGRGRPIRPDNLVIWRIRPQP